MPLLPLWLMKLYPMPTVWSIVLPMPETKLLMKMPLSPFLSMVFGSMTTNCEMKPSSRASLWIRMPCSALWLITLSRIARLWLSRLPVPVARLTM